MQRQFPPSKIYLDTCCLGRPFDDQAQDRVRQETGALRRINAYFLSGDLRWIVSDAVAYEVSRNPNALHREDISTNFKLAYQTVLVGEEETARAIHLEEVGFHWFDALHIACAESGGADVLLTTDDGMLTRAKRLGAQLHVRIENPYIWLQEIER